MEFEPAAGFEESVAGADVRGPGGHAGDQETAKDQVGAAGREVRVPASEEVVVVALDEGDVLGLFAVRGDGGEVDAVDLGGGELATEVIGGGAGAAAYVEDLARGLDGGLEYVAAHDLLYEFMLAVESLVLGRAGVR